MVPTEFYQFIARETDQQTRDRYSTVVGAGGEQRQSSSWESSRGAGCAGGNGVHRCSRQRLRLRHVDLTGERHRYPGLRHYHGRLGLAAVEKIGQQRGQKREH